MVVVGEQLEGISECDFSEEEEGEGGMGTDKMEIEIGIRRERNDQSDGSHATAGQFGSVFGEQPLMQQQQQEQWQYSYKKGMRSAGNP